MVRVTLTFRKSQTLRALADFSARLGDLINEWRHRIGLEAIGLFEGPELASLLRVPFTYCWSPVSCLRLDRSASVLDLRFVTVRLTNPRR